MGRNNKTASAEEIKTGAQDQAKHKMHAIAFLKRTDKGHYGQLITDLENQFTRGADQYTQWVSQKLLTYSWTTRNRRLWENVTTVEDAKETETVACVQQANAEPPIEET